MFLVDISVVHGENESFSNKETDGVASSYGMRIIAPLETMN